MSDIGSPPPLIYLSDLTAESEQDQFAHEPSPEPASPLYQSLEAALQHPSCVSAAWIDTVGDFKNNPRALHARPYNDGSLHWVDREGKLLCMAFPALLDLDGKYGRTGPYFSLASEQGVKKTATAAALAKIKAVFELTPLKITDSDGGIPPEAAQRSSMAMNVLQTFFSSVESKRNENVDISKRPATTPFHRTDFDWDRFKFVVNTGPLFRNMPDPGKMPINALSLADLKSAKSAVLPTPNQFQQEAENSNLVEEVTDGQSTDVPSVRTIADMPDPDGIYSSTLGATDVSKSFIDTPNIRDGNGVLIQPNEYQKKLESGSIVMVNAYLKLWNLRPSNRTNSGYRSRDGEQNGSRVYQMMLNSMQVLPVANISQIALLDNQIADAGKKEKRKAQNEPTTPSTTKRKARDHSTKVATRSTTRIPRTAPAKDDVPMQVV